MPDNEVNAEGKDVDTIAAILVEVRDTAGDASIDELKDMLRARIEKTSVQVTDGELAKLASQIRDGA